MLLVNLSNQADKFFSTLDAKQFRQIVKEIFKLAKTPKQNDIKKIISKDKVCYYRKDIGEFRVIFKIVDNILHVVVVEKRNDDSVYKIFKRK
ncbi:type II toxin-antitoxin system RelE family toxin [Candidatus Aquarickettsia rohweri]|uniref:Type II toxin-antitoxin system RelE/ParE family toxin n=1 Tax=Candidatus Aquarickettsia rohweri TaxID=2602574 RepID=A0A3R9ZIF9_9RICK|nr:type II toxin-antitoxin system RelE/ParE family toxin [Candidatus Aquarickettsia rohweri]RST62145.1 type II toxin-antitoxin system RelE/ParE family toxin [Candidatus Aquarickettsia rohweri]